MQFFLRCADDFPLSDRVIRKVFSQRSVFIKKMLPADNRRYASGNQAGRVVINLK